MRHAIRGNTVVALVLTVVVTTPADSSAQLTVLNSIGYGAAGTTLGLLATSGAECTGSSFICIPPEMVIAGLGGMVTGVLVGTRLGRSAEANVERGERAGNLGAVSVGAVLGGATLGLIVGGEVFARDDGPGTVLGSDEQSAIILGLAGAGLATLYLRSRWGELTGNALEVTPAIVGGEVGLSAQIRF